MVRYTSSRRNKRRRSSGRRRPAVSRHEPRMQTRGKDNKTRGGFQSGAAAFLRRHIKVIASVFIVLVVAGVALGIVFGGRETTGDPSEAE